MKKIKVLNFSALSYSGTTWLNLLLGSHKKVFTLGPPHRVWDLREDSIGGACLVHGNQCPFWQGFDSYWDREENFFIALSQYSGKNIFLMDNAHPEFIDATFYHQDVEVLNGRYIRDARAITASYARKVAHQNISYIETIQPDGWFYPSFQAIPSLEEMQKSNLFIARYEDAVNDQAEFLRNAGELLDITYNDDAFKFWEWDHHITSGNQGPIAMIKLFQGLNVGDFESKNIYQQQLNRLKQNPTHAFNDERWKSQLTETDLIEFDRLMGEKNQTLGYLRANPLKQLNQGQQTAKKLESNETENKWKWNPISVIKKIFLH